MAEDSLNSVLNIRRACLPGPSPPPMGKKATEHKSIATRNQVRWEENCRGLSTPSLHTFERVDILLPEAAQATPPETKGRMGRLWEHGEIRRVKDPSPPPSGSPASIAAEQIRPQSRQALTY